MLAPPDTVGPSNPAYPPNPIVIGAVKIEENILYAGMIPLRFYKEYKTDGIP